ncbi:MAG: hypothetical protein XE08_0149 [Parcubacteria bacterium 32_520]|nr:MAG: hypothetical protein XE08_0149 [Parcubacteria bacterium 32_520]
MRTMNNEDFKCVKITKQSWKKIKRYALEQEKTMLQVIDEVADQLEKTLKE